MAEVIELTARARDRVGKGAARAVRREGFVPAVIYGGKQAPVAIAMEPKALRREIAKPAFFTHLVDIDVDGAKHRVLARDVQVHPVTDQAMHVDFLRVSDTTRITVGVPVEFVNEDECPGIRRGGMLNVVRHEIELNCLAAAIPEQLTADLAGLEIGDSIHISSIALPEGVAPTITDRDFTVATIAAPTVVREEAAEAAAEAEVIEVEEAAVEAEEAAAEGEGAEEEKGGE